VPPSELDHPQAAACVLQPRDASREVSSPSALAAGEVHSPRVCLTRYVPPPGFLTLLTAYALSSPPALFHAGSAHGVLPFRAFPFERSRLASRRPQPSCRWPDPIPPAHHMGRHEPPRGDRAPLPHAAFRRLASRLGSRAWYLVEVRSRAAGVTRRTSPMLSWGSSLSRASRRPDLGMMLPPSLLP
jgi:hypothetical protein